MKFEFNERMPLNIFKVFGKLLYIDKEETPLFEDGKVVQGKFSNKRVTVYSDVVGNNIVFKLPEDVVIPELKFDEEVTMLGNTQYMPWTNYSDGRTNRGITLLADGIESKTMKVTSSQAKKQTVAN